MTVRRFLLGLVAALLLQATAFAVYYDDLLFLRRPPDELAGESRDVFVRHAERALSRPRLTVRHLDSIASGAKAFGLSAIEIEALERRVAAHAADRSGHLRLADALRRAGRYSEAEATYLAILVSAETPRP